MTDFSATAWTPDLRKRRPLHPHISKYDVFISHASEDAVAIVEPLVHCLLANGVKVWYAKREIKWGDSITDRINDGLNRCRYVLIVLSPAFMGKSWSRREMNAALEKEAETGIVRVLPLFVGTDKEVKQLRSQLSLQADKLYLRWDGNAQYVADEFLRILAQ